MTWLRSADGLETVKWKDEMYNCTRIGCHVSATNSMPTCGRLDCPVKLARAGHNPNASKCHCDVCLSMKYEAPKTMTREEAFNKIRLIVDDPMHFLNALEALGLIKFDKPTYDWSTDKFKIDPDKEFYGHGITKSNLESLRQAGYEIVQRKPVVDDKPQMDEKVAAIVNRDDRVVNVTTIYNQTFSVAGWRLVEAVQSLGYIVTKRGNN